MRLPQRFTAALPILLVMAAPHVFGQCQDKEAAAATLKSIEAEISHLQDGLQTDFNRARATLVEKARARSWSDERANAFLQDIRRSKDFVAIHSQVESRASAANVLLQSAESPEIKNDPLKSCTLGLKLRDMMLATFRLSREELNLVNQRIAAIE